MDTNNPGQQPYENADEYDFTHVNNVARIALYDDMLSAPRVTIIEPAPTGEFIETLASRVYEQAKEAGGTIPYTVIREVSENFIHARFREATVSILEGGNTVRFADQGPGIPWKDRAQLPGFSSATEPMKSYIRGVGSGLPIVKEYLEFTHGTITIEDNLGTGSVVTISARGEEGGGYQETESNPTQEEISPQSFMTGQNAAPYAYAQPANAYQNQGFPSIQGQTQSTWPAYQQQNPQMQAWGNQVPQAWGAEAYQAQQMIGMPQNPMGIGAVQAPQMTQMPQTYPQATYPQPMGQGAYQQGINLQPILSNLSDKERKIIKAIAMNGALGGTELNHVTNVPISTVHQRLKKLETDGLVIKGADKKYVLTETGMRVAQQI